MASEFQEIKIIPTTIAGLNINLASGLKRGQKPSQSDVIKAYMQSDLQTENDTYIELPEELVPDHLKWMRRPCTKLHKSLCGHPDSWEELNPLCFHPILSSNDWVCWSPFALMILLFQGLVKTTSGFRQSCQSTLTLKHSKMSQKFLVGPT